MSIRNHIFLNRQANTMFDEQDYYSDEEDNVMMSLKNAASSKVLAPSTGPEFNNMASDNQSLMRMMKDRGFDLSDNEMKKIKGARPQGRSTTKDKDSKPKAGFFDGGDKASLEELTKALNKAFSKADPQQASCILSYILEKKNLSPEDRNKFGIMKCNILFGLGAYLECQLKSQQLLGKPYNKLSGAIFSNFIAKCKAQNNDLLSGYMDFLRAKSQIEDYKDELEQQERQKEEKKRQELMKSESKSENSNDEFVKQSEVDSTMREINHTEMEYNIKMSKYKNNTNLIYPHYPQFRHRRILQVVCGDFHTLFLVGGPLSGESIKDGEEKKWETEVFGLGENTVGQITGIGRQVIYKEPILISSLSGKGIEGIYATKETSLAYDAQGNIYEWGIKEQRNEQINITYTVGEQILKLEKGYRHYALLTKSGKFYSWGIIENKGVPVYTQAKPHMQESKNIIGFSCGKSHTIALDSEGNVYALGSNEHGQLGIFGERLTKTFRKINNGMAGFIKKVFAIGDCTFFVNDESQVFYCGKYSYNKEPQQKLHQAEFPEEFKDLVCISGSIGVYYASNQIGTCFKWDADTVGGFKIDREDEKNCKNQRYVEGCRAYVYKVRSTIKPQFCEVMKKTEDLRTYEPIDFEITLKDQFGLFGVSDFIIPPKCQIFLSTYKAKPNQISNDNKLFIESHSFCTTNTDKILLNEIIMNRLLEYKVTRRENEPWMADLTITAEASGLYYFYIFIEDKLIYQKQLDIQVSEKEKELEEKNKQERMLKEEERRRKAELERQRLAEEKLRKEMEEDERRKETQKRAEEALKKHMREQEEAKMRQDEERKARKQLQTGGGFDLNKLKKKNSSTEKIKTALIQPGLQSQELTKANLQRSEKMEKTGESFFPDINQRPNSRKKINLPKPSELIGSFREGQQKTILKSSVTDFSSTGFVSEKPSTPMKMNSTTVGVGKTSSTTVRQPSTGKGLVKRGVSKKS